MKLLRTFFIFGIALAAAQAGARANLFERIPISAGKADLYAVRYLNPNGKPNSGKAVIFSHGLASNLHEFQYLVDLFMRAGYDCYAFNYRGHGNGNERSKVRLYTEGDYGIEKMAGEDFPAVLAAVEKLNGGKIIIVGHSMGGMNTRGAYALGKVDRQQIEAMILLGSPPHFDTQRSSRQSLDIFGLMRMFDHYINSGRGDADVSTSGIDPSFETLLDFAGGMHLGYWLLKGAAGAAKGIIVNALGATALDVPSEWMKVAMSEKIPKDILRSFSGFTGKEEYPFKDVAIPWPILHIMGETDALVSHTDIATHARTQSEEAGYWLAKVKGVGHMALVTPKAIDAYKDTLFEFLAAEGLLGESHRSFFEITPRCEGHLAKRVKLTN